MNNNTTILSEIPEDNEKPIIPSFNKEDENTGISFENLENLTSPSLNNEGENLPVSPVSLNDLQANQIQKEALYRSYADSLKNAKELLAKHKIKEVHEVLITLIQTPYISKCFWIYLHCCEMLEKPEEAIAAINNVLLTKPNFSKKNELDLNISQAYFERLKHAGPINNSLIEDNNIPWENVKKAIFHAIHYFKLGKQYLRAIEILLHSPDLESDPKKLITLASLYISIKNYNEALITLNKLKNPNEKALKMIEKIKSKLNKEDKEEIVRNFSPSFLQFEPTIEPSKFSASFPQKAPIALPIQETFKQESLNTEESIKESPLQVANRVNQNHPVNTATSSDKLKPIICNSTLTPSAEIKLYPQSIWDKKCHEKKEKSNPTTHSPARP